MLIRGGTIALLGRLRVRLERWVSKLGGVSGLREWERVFLDLSRLDMTSTCKAAKLATEISYPNFSVEQLI